MLLSATSLLNYAPLYFEERYKNLIYAKVNFTKLVAATSASDFMSSNAIWAGYGLYNLGDVLRIVLLLLFGGTHFDTDMISVKPIPYQHKVRRCRFYFYFID